ncbi:MAG: hypothetical protein A2007_05515 [Verrucomicrobia bacterium GWC2_42_7]|nr:MAG: hypothetical protein A2007_05515 [Verrucomicrobia bacterium GWC2_42_7]
MIYANSSACKLLGYEEDELKGISFFDIDPLACAIHKLNDHIREENEINKECVFRKKGGTLIPIETSTSLFSIGKKQCVRKSFRDISKRKEDEQRLLQNLEKEKELSSMKSLFVNIVSHEFRTPLTSISGSVDLLENYWEKLDEGKRQKQMSSIKTSIRRMVKIMEDILTLGKLQSQESKFKPQQVSLNNLCQKIKEDLELSMENRSIEIKGDFFKQIYADETLLYFILVNLLSNALKYSPADTTPTLTITVNEKQACFEVEDKGIGIPEEEKDKLFNLFHRCKNVSNIKGMGIGMFLVKNSVDLHKGTIEISSQESKGSKFVVRLPLGEPLLVPQKQFP